MKYFISDLHLGCGDSLDDFILQDTSISRHLKSPEYIKSGIKRMHMAFSSFIDYILSCSGTENTSSGSNEKPELVLLGDTFDLLQVLPEDRFNPEKIHLIARIHDVFFSSLKKFHKEGGRIVIIPGNHDHDLLHPALFKALNEHLPFLSREFNSELPLYYHSTEPEIYAEHGNQFDLMNAFQNPHNPEEWPFGSELVLRLVNPLERKYPIMDNMGIREALWYALHFLPETVSKKNRKSLGLDEAIEHPAREIRLKHLAWYMVHRMIPECRSDFFSSLWQILLDNEKVIMNNASFSDKFKGALFTFRKIGRNPFRIFQEIQTDHLHEAAKEIINGNSSIAIGNPATSPDIVILGHSHRPCRKRMSKGKYYINTGSWRMRLLPFRRFSYRIEQPLDYVKCYRNTKGKWSVRLCQWQNNFK
jgi:UDP-2,3-diacylglucosamine pyrophosphatase LpxH